ncbi:hypothetical protein [Prevotella sp. AGR2160]|uniref:hypothetical protein n=1 Tax=Prevotella sp. AGR2160 TaxID=1280674 RepID=UPI0003F7AFEA|nr:hypothetical protein [Prevotella sp. AGR2160]
MMKIIEQYLCGKVSDDRCEDGIVTTPSFVAVIDGSTSKTPRHIHPTLRNGRYAMLLISDAIRQLPADVSRETCIQALTDVLHRQYHQVLPPEERLTASAIIYSDVRREIWMIGDCQCLVDGVLYENGKPSEREHAEKRARYILAHPDDPDAPEKGRALIVPDLVRSMREGQNKQYAVLDGYPVFLPGVKTIAVERAHEIVLASDGYPFLKPTLSESEEALQRQLHDDPQNIHTFLATKGLVAGNRSFDDRAYIRFRR